MTPSMTEAVLQIFADAAEPPSHLRERRAWRAALRRRGEREGERERARLRYHADKFLRRRVPVDRLPLTAACPSCGLEFGTEQALRSHERYWHYRCGGCAEPQAAE